MARHWLDVVRYAELERLRQRLCAGIAWRYRDYSSARSTCDRPPTPLHQPSQQLAGDEMWSAARPEGDVNASRAPDAELLIARVLRWAGELTGMEVPKVRGSGSRRRDDSVGQVFSAPLQARVATITCSSDPHARLLSLQAVLRRAARGTPAIFCRRKTHRLREEKISSAARGQYRAILKQLARSRSPPPARGCGAEARSRRVRAGGGGDHRPWRQGRPTRTRGRLRRGAPALMRRGIPEAQIPPKLIALRRRLRDGADRAEGSRAIALGISSGMSRTRSPSSAPTRSEGTSSLRSDPRGEMREGELGNAREHRGDPWPPGRRDPGRLSAAAAIVAWHRPRRGASGRRWRPAGVGGVGSRHRKNPLTARVMASSDLVVHFGHRDCRQPEYFWRHRKKPTHPNCSLARSPFIAGDANRGQPARPWSVKALRGFILIRYVSARDAIRADQLRNPTAGTGYADSVRDGWGGGTARRDARGLGELNRTHGGIRCAGDAPRAACSRRQVMGTFARSGCFARPSTATGRPLCVEDPRAAHPFLMSSYAEPPISRAGARGVVGDPQVSALQRVATLGRALALAAGPPEAPTRVGTLDLACFSSRSVARRRSASAPTRCTLTRCARGTARSRRRRRPRPREVVREAVDENTTGESSRSWSRSSRGRLRAGSSSGECAGGNAAQWPRSASRSFNTNELPMSIEKPARQPACVPPRNHEARLPCAGTPRALAPRAGRFLRLGASIGPRVDVAARRATAAARPRARSAAPARALPARGESCIFSDGGRASHIDTFDPSRSSPSFTSESYAARKMKSAMEAANATSCRGPFRFRKAGRSGATLPRMGAFRERVDDLCFFRGCQVTPESSAASINEHGNRRRDLPAIGSWVNYGLGSFNQDLPGFASADRGLVSKAAPPWGNVSCRRNSRQAAAVEGSPILALTQRRGFRRASARQHRPARAADATHARSTPRRMNSPRGPRV